MEMIEVIQDDCLNAMREFPDKSFDMILCDLPYGTTACSWDTIIPFEPLWEQYKRIIKRGGAIVLSSAQPFTSALVMSNISQYKHHWVWLKEKGTGFQVAKYRPMMATEDIIGFCGETFKTYNPQMTQRDKPIRYRYPTKQSDSNPLANYNKKVVESSVKYPENVIYANTETGQHPTQKPLSLFAYLIKTYTNEGDRVLDNCAGSGTTGIACHNLKRDCVLIEKEPKYVEIIKKRLADLPPTLF